MYRLVLRYSGVTCVVCCGHLWSVVRYPYVKGLSNGAFAL